MGLFDIFSDKNAQEASRHQIESLDRANSEGQEQLKTGYDDINRSYQAGLQPLLQNYASGTGGANAYGDATGANGAAGNARAVQNFQANPGYEFTRDQGTQNVLRQNAAQGYGAGSNAGMSGNTDIALANYTSGLANQTYQQYVQNLQPYLGQQTQTGGQIAQMDASLGNAQNANRTNAANMVYGTRVGQGNAAASADLAGNQASANGINGIMKAGEMLAGFI